MGDISLPWGGDLSEDESGDIADVSGVDELSQRVVRRFLTNAYQAPTAYLPANPPDYIYDGTYGGNARLYVDRRINSQVLAKMQKRLLASCTAEVLVSRTTPPVITASYQGGAAYISGQVTLANNQVLILPLLQLGG